MNTLTNNGFTKFKNGAQRDEYIAAVRLDLIPKEFLFAVGKTLSEGAVKYGEHNWRKGLPTSSTMNHVLQHIAKYIEGDVTEEHLAHAACGLMFQIYFDAHPEKFAEFDDRYVQIQEN